MSRGEVYATEGGKLFLKMNDTEGAGAMFQGELEGLRAIRATNTIRL